MTIKQLYIREFTTAKDFKEWVQSVHKRYKKPMTTKCFEIAEYELTLLHRHFGTCDPDLLIDILYPLYPSK